MQPQQGTDLEHRAEHDALSAFSPTVYAPPRAILWIAPKWPLPADDGARLATCDLLQSAARRHEVHLLGLVGRDEACRPDEARALLGVQGATALRRADPEGAAPRWARYGRAALGQPLLPLSLAPYAGRELRRRIDGFLDGRRWDLTIFDGLHGAAAFSAAGRFRGDPRLGRIVYRAHNVESLLWEQSSERERGTARRMLLALQAARMRGFEGSLVTRAIRTLTVSPDDAARFRGRHPELAEDRWGCVPIGMRFPEQPPPVPSSGLRLLFLGRLDWPPNRQGLEWFLTEVWPRAATLRADLSLDIAGRGDGRWLTERLLRAPARDRLRVLGRITSVDEAYARTSLALAPVFVGSGTRVKVLEAARFGRATLATALGAQGLGLEPGRSYLRAESRDDFVRALIQTTPAGCSALGMAAFEHMRAGFDSAVVAERLESTLGELAGDRSAHPSLR